jgi:hypothetical protein
MTLNSRSEIRVQTGHRTWLDAGDGALGNCGVVDIAENGAKPAADAVDRIPATFGLAPSLRGHRRHACRIFRRQPDALRVKFAFSLRSFHKREK